MNAGLWIRAALAGAALACSAQGPTAGERIAQLSGTLGIGSEADAAGKIAAIQEIAELGTVSALASSLLFDRATFRIEPDPLVREAAALALRKVCDLRNRMLALRLGRITAVRAEPDPRVRVAALRSLAAFRAGEAPAFIYDAAMEEKEPDPSVRAAAKELIQKGLAASLY